MRPLILTVGAALEHKKVPRRICNEAYNKGVYSGGGTLVCISPFLEPEAIDELVECCDGILLAGGCDIHPEQYKGDVDTNCEYDTARDGVEFKLVRDAIKHRKPILGICRGMQMMNVALGGTLRNLSVDEEKIHTRGDLPRNQTVHLISPVSGTTFAEICGTERLRVNSMHHQVINEASKRLTVCAISSEDGQVEAVILRDPSHPFFVGVQCHIEELLHLEFARALFKAFIEAAS